MPITLYTQPISPYCRSVLFTARALGVNLDLKIVDLSAKEQFKPEFIKINPQHTIPTLVDDDVVLWESRAICMYLVSQYGKDDSLYPKDPKARAKVDALIHFDMGTLVGRWNIMFGPVKTGILSKPTQENVDKFHEALGWYNDILSHKKFAAGTDHVTIADHILVSNISSYMEAGFIIQDYPNIYNWVQKCKDKIDGYEELNGEGAKQFGDYVKAKITGK